MNYRFILRQPMRKWGRSITSLTQQQQFNYSLLTRPREEQLAARQELKDSVSKWDPVDNQNVVIKTFEKLYDTPTTVGKVLPTEEDYILLLRGVPTFLDDEFVSLIETCIREDPNVDFTPPLCRELVRAWGINTGPDWAEKKFIEFFNSPLAQNNLTAHKAGPLEYLILLEAHAGHNVRPQDHILDLIVESARTVTNEKMKARFQEVLDALPTFK
mmetsp:Transcript_3466/g.5100  ORF Transcript_3466/g.5100 Transcript_3466/m.5100 type:complete len:215 (+) Transcript_3466:70-714(+)